MGKSIRRTAGLIVPWYLTGFWLWLTLVQGPVCQAAGPADYTAVIKPQAVLVPRFEGWGTSLCWWANVLGDATNREQYADLAFKQLQLNIVRYNIGGGENPALPKFMQPRARVPGFEPKPGVWDWSADANQRWFLRAAVQRGVDHVEAFANSPPYWMTVSGSVTGATNGADDNLRVDCETAFADYLATVVSNLTVLDGIKFNTLAPMNEPGSDWWYYGNRQEGTHMSHAQQSRMIQQLRPALAQCGLKTGLVASEDNDEQNAINAVKSYDPGTLAPLIHLATHTYKANNPDGLCQLAATLGKPLWVTEYGDGEDSGLMMARRIRDDIAQTHACAWIYWQFAEPDSNWGLVRYHRRDASRALSITRKFYVLAQFSCFVRPGFQILDSDDPNSLVAYDQAGHRLVIVSVNDLARPLKVVFDLAAFHPSNSPVKCIRTSAEEDLQPVNGAEISSGKLAVTVAPGSVTTWVVATAGSPVSGN